MRECKLCESGYPIAGVCWRCRLRRLRCKLFGHPTGVPYLQSHGRPRGSRTVFTNDMIYIYCPRCFEEVKRVRDW